MLDEFIILQCDPFSTPDKNEFGVSSAITIARHTPLDFDIKVLAF